MNFLLRSALKSWKLIKQRPFFFILIILIQLIFLISFISTGLHYQNLVVKDFQSIAESLQHTEKDIEEFETGKSNLNNLRTIKSKVESVKGNLIDAILSLLSIFIVINGMIWISTHLLINKERFKWKVLIEKFVASSIIFSSIFSLLVYLTFQRTFFTDITPASFENLIQMLTISFFVINYFLLIAFALINTPSWKNYTKQIYFIGINKIHKVLLTIFICGLILSPGILLVYYSTINLKMATYIIPITLLISVLIVISRIFWTKTIQDISKK